MNGLLRIRWLLLAIGSAGLLLLFTPVVAVVGFWTAVVCFALWTVLTVGAKLKRRDRYDLNELKEVHQRAYWQDEQALPPDPAEDADAYCHSCGQFYSNRYPTCPYCAERSG